MIAKQYKSRLKEAQLNAPIALSALNVLKKKFH